MIRHVVVKDRPPFKRSDLWRELKTLVDDRNNAIVAHNAQFDIAMLNHEDINPNRVICTLILARLLDQAGVIPQYGLQYLRYYLELLWMPKRAMPWVISQCWGRFLSAFTLGLHGTRFKISKMK
jgi:DNA polymerase III alpha subunit (gram-positive type)